MKQTLRFLLPLGTLILALSETAGKMLAFNPKDLILLAIINGLLFFSGWGILFAQVNALHDGNPHRFVRSVMGGMALKMVIFLGAVIAYAITERSHINSGLVFISIGLYLAYLIAEVYFLMKLNRQKNA
jgi:hypothetical protein